MSNPHKSRQLPVGVLFDIFHEASEKKSIPWRLTVHFAKNFQSFPEHVSQFKSYQEVVLFCNATLELLTFFSSLVLPKLMQGDKKRIFERHYFHSLKQGLFLEHGKSVVAMALDKEKQQQLWESLNVNDARTFCEVNRSLKADNVFDKGKRVPVRLVVRAGRDVIQPASGTESSASTTLGELIKKHISLPSHGSLEAICHGVRMKLDVQLANLWLALAYPDHFLYVVVKLCNRQ